MDAPHALPLPALDGTLSDDPPAGDVLFGRDADWRAERRRMEERPADSRPGRRLLIVDERPAFEHSPNLVNADHPKLERVPAIRRRPRMQRPAVI